MALWMRERTARAFFQAHWTYSAISRNPLVARHLT